MADLAAAGLHGAADCAALQRFAFRHGAYAMLLLSSFRAYAHAAFDDV